MKKLLTLLPVICLTAWLGCGGGTVYGDTVYSGTDAFVSPYCLNVRSIVDGCERCPSSCVFPTNAAARAAAAVTPTQKTNPGQPTVGLPDA